MQNSYHGVLADWKVELIRQRARLHRVRPQDLPDIEQELALKLTELDYNSEHEDGASERTFVTEVIDRSIRALLRKERRYRSRVAEEDGNGLPEEFEFDERLYRSDVVADVRHTLSELDETDRAICLLLSDGASISVVAAKLNADWHAVQRRIENIRKRFSALDSDGGSASAENDESPLLINARDAASMCGRSERTWRTWDSAGWIPQPVRIGRSTMWRRDELHAWITAGCPRRDDWEIRRQSST
jgi:DNA-directed RNA polymerase specialized sigma24 family protein